MKTNKKGEFVQIGIFPGDYVITAEKDNEKANAEMPVSIGENPDVNMKLSHTGPSPEARPKQDALQKSFDEGVAASKAGNNDEAIAKFTEAAGMVPNCADCYYNIGVRQRAEAESAGGRRGLQEGHRAQARSRATRWRTSPTSTTPRRSWISRSRRRARPDSAAAARPARRRRWRQPDVALQRGRHPLEPGQVSRGQGQVRGAAKADPSNAEAQYRLGMANVNLGDMAGATAAFEAYLKAAPNGPHAAEVKGFIAAMKK